MSKSAATGRRRPAAWRAELAATLALALPLVATNLAQTGLTTADVILFGRLGSDALAAGALATNLYFALAFLGIGLVSATAPLMAEALGRGRGAIRDVRRTLRQGLWSCAAVSVPVWLLLWHGEPILIAIGQDPRLAAEAGPYLRALQWGLLPFLGFGVLRFFISALGRPGWGLAVGLGAIPVNVALAIWLIYGGAGVPALGLVGAGIATSLTSALMFGALALVLVLDRRFRRWSLFGRFWRPDAPRFRRLWRLGMPIAATLAFEIGVFNAAALVVGTFGTAPLAAHAIALQIAATLFMVPLGIAQAASIRVGLAYGAGDPARITLAGRVAIGVSIVFTGASALLLVLLPETLVGIFVERRDPAQAEVVALAATFLAFAALFQLADGLQAVASGLLRGLQDTRVPMLLAGLGYWGIGATLGVALAWPAGLAGVGVWIGLSTGLAIVAALLLRRWTRRGRPGGPNLAGEPGLALAAATAR